MTDPDVEWFADAFKALDFIERRLKEAPGRRPGLKKFENVCKNALEKLVPHLRRSIEKAHRELVSSRLPRDADGNILFDELARRNAL